MLLCCAFFAFFYLAITDKMLNFAEIFNACKQIIVVAESVHREAFLQNKPKHFDTFPLLGERPSLYICA